MTLPDVSTVLRGLEVTVRPGRFRFEKSDDETRRLAAAAVVTEPEGVTLIEPDDEGDWAWLTIAVETDLDLVGLTAALAPALAEAGLPANILAGFHHDHVLVPFDRAEHAVVTLESLRSQPRAAAYAATSAARDPMPVDALMAASGLVARLLTPEMAAVLGFLHRVGRAGCTDRELLDALGGEPRTVLGLLASLVDAGLATPQGGRTRITDRRPPQLATTLRELAAGPLRVPRELGGYLDNGRIARYPKNDDELTALLEHVVELIGPGTVHSELTLTEALAPIAEPAELRRRLVDHGLVERTASGSRYVVRARV
jgi:hypothetical protein